MICRVHREDSDTPATPKSTKVDQAEAYTQSWHNSEQYRGDCSNSAKALSSAGDQVDDDEYLAVCRPKSCGWLPTINTVSWRYEGK
jgi:hypothetical protein